MRADDFEPDPGDLLQRFAPRDERRQHEAAERPVIEQQGAQRFPLDGDVPHRLRGPGGHECRLPGQEIDLAEELRRAVSRDLVAGGVEHGDLPFQDHDEGVVLIADPVQGVALGGRALLPQLGDRREL